MDNENCILQVALPTPLRKTFDYISPANVLIKSGVRVKVPFGKREIIGIIWQVKKDSDLPRNKLKHIIEIIDPAPLFDSVMLSLYSFASQYYQHSIGDVIFSSLPPSLRDGQLAALPEEILFSLTATGSITEEQTFKHAIQQQKLISLLKAHPNGLTREEIEQLQGQSKALTALLAKGLVQKITRSKTVSSDFHTTGSLLLNEHQQQAVAAINNQNGFATFLLEGVTGSGKTEVYLHCIEEKLKRNLQTLILVPEIGLTPQTVARFQQRFNVPISILHSGLTDKERANAWVLAKEGKARIIIGTRSAILTPLPNLGLIILDEEHDASFKQQSGFRYSAKDLAIMRGKLTDVPVLLGSATPCLESIFNVKQKRFQHLILPKRAGNATPAHFHVVDVRSHKLEEGFSHVVLQKMTEHLEKKGQVLIFLNRRGYAPTLLCHHCGWIANCSRCDARFTYHSQLEKLICHHCASIHNTYKRCHSCHSHELLFLGLGTQRLEKLLRDRFPKVTVTRIDRDSTRRKGAMDKILSEIHNGESQILIGTQMLAKGHHFPAVTMVAIIDIDNSLYSSDFRASERLGQIIIQVAGRAGRGDKPGEVYLQTHNPENQLLTKLIEKGYSNFAQFLLSERKSAQLPPYTHMVLFRAESNNAAQSNAFLSDVKKLLQKNNADFQIYGPIPASMEKKAGKFRSQLLIQTKHRSALQKSLQPTLTEIELMPSSRKVRWSVDVDPIDVF